MSATPSPSARPGWELHAGDALDLLRGLADRSVDAVVTDPPYGIGMRDADLRVAADGKTDIEGMPFERWVAIWSSELMRVLKPGGHVLAFGAPRMVHRLARGLEDGGLELRDQLLWLYGSGVPKSRTYGGRSSTLKPGYEPIILARAPLAGSLAATTAAFGTGLLGIDDARIPDPTRARGRWPCNVALSHNNQCVPHRCQRGCTVGLLDRSSPRARPSRFYYCAKASRREREAGCDRLPERHASTYGSATRRPRRNTHPTVKPIALMRWLVRLACPPGGLVLDPFAGSGSTGVACLAERRRFLGFERKADFARIAKARLTHAGHRTAVGQLTARTDGRTADGTRGSVRRTSINPSEVIGGVEP